MIIKELQIQNFGRHREINFKCNAQVVGLLGPNGSGKSTVLDAIEFAITGETRDPIPSYVRHGEGNAAVSLTFVKNGMEGYIFRQFGKTPKRKLVWDGKTITAAREVDATMTSIFGADKQAIANAVFINQGSLDKILFPVKESDRRELFIKLVNMGFCDQVANMLEGKIKKIQATMVDLGPALDAAVLQVQQTDAARVAQQIVYASYADHTADWNYCDRFIQNEAKYQQVLGQLTNLQQQARMAQDQITPLLEAERMSTYEQLQSAMLQWEHELGQQRVDLASWRSIKSELLHYQRVSGEITISLRQLREAQTRMEQTNPAKMTMAEIEARITELGPIISREMERRQLATQLGGTKEALKIAEKLYQDRPMPTETWEQISERQNKISQLDHTITTLATFLAKQKEFAACAQMKFQRPEGGVQCVQCGLIISNPEALSEDSIRSTEQTLTTIRAERETAAQTHRQLKTQWESCDQAGKRLGASVSNLQATRDEQFARLLAYQEQDITRIEAQYRHAIGLRELLPELERSISTLNQDVGRLMTERATYTKAMQNLDRVATFTDAEERKLTDALELRQEQHKAKRARFDEITRLVAVLGSLNKQIDQHLTAKQELSAALEEPTPPAVAELSLSLSGNLTAVRAEFQARGEARSSAYGRLTQAVEAANGAVATHQELLKRVESDKEKRKLIEDLVILRDTMRPAGLPMAVVQYHFSHLAAMTQSALNQLDANFCIQIDHETPLSFKFSRLDEPEHEPLPMSKLSGGQRVRLCTAFLIAVQQRLVKEVGLLVLDEPSTHIDEAGVDSLAELLRTLGSQLQNTETQIFVSDHHPRLKNCFSTVLELT